MLAQDNRQLIFHLLPMETSIMRRLTLWPHICLFLPRPLRQRQSCLSPTGFSTSREGWMLEGRRFDTMYFVDGFSMCCRMNSSVPIRLPLNVARSTLWHLPADESCRLAAHICASHTSGGWLVWLALHRMWFSASLLGSFFALTQAGAAI